MSKHTCTHCHQNLIPVHPIEVRRAIQLLVALSKDPKKKMDEHQALSNLCGNGSVWCSVAKLARAEAALRIEPDRNKWSSEWTSQEYNLAAQILSDGWLPVGYILVKDKEIDECEHTQNEEYVPDPDGNVTVGEWGKPPVKCRRVVTHIPESERVHDDYYCPLSKDPF